MKNNRKFRTYDYLSLMMTGVCLFNLWNIGYDAFVFGIVITLSMISLGTIFSIDKNEEEETNIESN